MPENSGITQEKPTVLRNPDGTYPKGVSGNPDGPKAGYRHMTTKLLDAITKVSDNGGDADDVAIVKKLVEKAKGGDMRGIELILGYIDGKPQQNLGIGAPEGGNIKIEISMV